MGLAAPLVTALYANEGVPTFSAFPLHFFRINKEKTMCIVVLGGDINRAMVQKTPEFGMDELNVSQSARRNPFLQSL